MIKDIIIVAVLVAITVSILVYIGKQKKKGNKCIGCPHGGNCSGNCADKKE
jgi:hypothetical protein